MLGSLSKLNTSLGVQGCGFQQVPLSVRMSHAVKLCSWTTGVNEITNEPPYYLRRKKKKEIVGFVYKKVIVK